MDLQKKSLLLEKVILIIEILNRRNMAMFTLSSHENDTDK